VAKTLETLLGDTWDIVRDLALFENGTCYNCRNTQPRPVSSPGADLFSSRARA
jgi:hypothetical protein